MSTPALPQTEIELKGNRYQLTALPSSVGQKALVRLLRVAGPAFAAAARESAATAERHLLDGVDPKALEALAQEFSGAAAFDALVRALTEDDYAYFVGLMTQNTEGWGGEGFVPITKTGGIGGPFVQDYGLQILLLKAFLEFNFSSFLADLASIVRPT